MLLNIYCSLIQFTPTHTHTNFTLFYFTWNLHEYANMLCGLHIKVIKFLFLYKSNNIFSVSSLTLVVVLWKVKKFFLFFFFWYHISGGKLLLKINDDGLHMMIETNIYFNLIDYINHVIWFFLSFEIISI